MNIYQEIASRRKPGEAVVVVTVVKKTGHSPSQVGTKMLVPASRQTAGTVGGGALEEEAVRKAGELLETGECLLQEYVFGKEKGGKEVKRLPMLCGGGATLFYEYIGAGETCVIFGAGHIGKAVAYHLQPIEFHIVLVDTREPLMRNIAEEGISKLLVDTYAGYIQQLNLPPGSYCIVATHSHEEDYKVLKSLIRSNIKPAYIGVIASSRKAASFLKKLGNECPEEIPENILYMPAGLDIGGPSPNEIALSLLAEIQALRYGKPGHRHMRERLNK